VRSKSDSGFARAPCAAGASMFSTSFRRAP
jgi:hypothetical protein